MRKQHGLTKKYACALFGKTRQGYDKVHATTQERICREEKLIAAVKAIRSEDPGIGGYKLWLMMKEMFQRNWVPGRDSFYKFLGTNNLTLPRPKPRTTTNSNHRYHKYRNLIKDFSPTGPNQLWVSDITYVDLSDDCCYLHLVTDAYSHKIVGWCLAESLHAIFTMKALQMAIDQAGGGNLSGLTHHSDRGTQYCCYAYTDMLREHNIAISMTEDYNPTENCIAERVNGIIKTEFIYKVARFKDMPEALQRIGKYIIFYNERRPHMSIGYHTPSEIHQQRGEQKKCWRNKDYSKNNSTFASPSDST